MCLTGLPPCRMMAGKPYPALRGDSHFFEVYPMNVRAALVALLVLPWPVVGALSAVGAEPAKLAGKKLVVNGSATVNVKPDAARVVFAVSTTMPDPKGARAENDKAVKKIQDALEGLKIKDLETHVTPGTVSTVQTNDPNAPAGPVQTKKLQTTFHVTVREKDAEKLRALATKLADTVAENGGIAVGSDDFQGRFGGFGPGGGGFPEVTTGPRIEWLAEDMAEARREAIKKAIAEARANAKAAVGDAPIEVAEITVTPSADTTGRFRSGRGGGFGFNPYMTNTGDSGPIPVMVEVQVTFTYP